jgi:hypothetical protein
MIYRKKGCLNPPIGGSGGVQEEFSKEKNKVNADKREKPGLMVFGGGVRY